MLDDPHRRLVQLASRLDGDPRAHALDRRQQTYPADTVLGIRQRAFLDGDREFRVLFEPAPRRAIQTFFWSGECFVLGWLDDLCSVSICAATPTRIGAKTSSLVCPLSGTVQLWSFVTISIRNPTATYSPHTGRNATTPSTFSLLTPRPCGTDRADAARR